MALREIWDGWIGRINLARSRANTQVGGPKFPLDLQRGNFNTEDWPCDTVLRGQEKGEGGGGSSGGTRSVRERLWGVLSCKTYGW